MRKEAQVQGVNTVKVWDCSVQCYDKRLIQRAARAVEGQYVWLNFLPFEDKGSNPDARRASCKYDKKPDGFGAQAFVAGEIFARGGQRHHQGEQRRPELDHPRPTCSPRSATCTTSTPAAWSPRSTSARKIGSTCLVGMQVQDGKFVRIDPVEPGKFDCDNDKPPLELTIDPAAEYKG